MVRDEEEKKIDENIQKKIDYVKEWASRAKGVKDATVYAQNVLESACWEQDALSNIPPGVAPPPGEIAAAMNNDLVILASAFPLPPRYDPILTASGTVVNTSGTLLVLSYVAEVGKYGTPDAEEYSRKYTSQYQEIQEKQHHAHEVRSLIQKLNNANVLERLDKAATAYSRLKAGTAERSEAGNEIRNLLHGLRALLWDMARKNPRENMTWIIMAERLAIGGPLSVECSTLKAEETKYISLQGRLSDVSKDREGSSLVDLDLIWTELIGHIYVVLGLVKFPTA